MLACIPERGFFHEPYGRTMHCYCIICSRVFSCVVFVFFVSGMSCPSLLYAAFGALVANRNECKLDVAPRVDVALEDMGRKRRKTQSVQCLISPPLVHVSLSTDNGELAHAALGIVFRLHAGCLGSFATDEWTRLQRAYEIVREYNRVSRPLGAHHLRWGGFEDTPRLRAWDKFQFNICDSMVTRIRKLSPAFIRFGAFYGGVIELQGMLPTVMIAHHIENLHTVHQTVHPWSFPSARAASVLASTRTPIRIVRV